MLITRNKIMFITLNATQRWTELFSRDVRQSGVHVASMNFSWWAERLHYFFKNIIHDRILQNMCDVFRRTPMMMRTFFSLCFHFREDMRIFTHFIPFLCDSSLLSRVLLANNACIWRLLRYGPQKKIYSWLFRIYIAIKKKYIYIVYCILLSIFGLDPEFFCSGFATPSQSFDVLLFI